MTQDLGPISKSELVRACEGAIACHVTLEPFGASGDPLRHPVAALLATSRSGGDFSTVKILLEESVDLNGTDSTGRTPLMFASGAGHLEARDGFWREGQVARLWNHPPCGFAFPFAMFD